jgi:short subunit fatty acids transporter
MAQAPQLWGTPTRPRSMDLFVPSAGSRWLIEAPFPIPAVTRMRSGDVVGYTFLVALVCLG